MKGYFKKRLYYDWVIYVGLAIVCVMLWYFAFSLFNAPAPTETVKIFFGGTVKDYSFKDIVKAEMSAYGVKAVEISSCDPADSVFKTKYSTVGLNGCDVVIVSEDIADKTECEGTFKEIEVSGDGYVRDGKVYGAYISDETKENLAAYFAFTDERYAAFIVLSSPNSGGDALTDTAVVFLEFLNGYGKDKTAT